MLCLGPLGWRPTELAIYGSLGSCAGNMMQTAGCAKALEKIGLRNTSAAGTLLSVAGAIGMVAVSVPLCIVSGTVATSQPAWAAKLLAVTGNVNGVSTLAAGILAYGVADHVLVRAWGGSQRYATQLLFIENVTPALNGRRDAAAAAFDGLAQLVTLVTPAIWVALYAQGFRMGRVQRVISGPIGTVLLVAASLRVCGSIFMSQVVTVEPAHRWETPD